VDSPHGDVLLTAAHCITGTGAGYVFAPGFHDGVSPHGRWRVTAAYLDPAWLARQAPERDFAFLLVAPRSIGGREEEIEQIAGANRLGLRPRSGQLVTVPAYPAGGDNDPVTCTVQIYYDGPYPAFNCNPYVDGTSGAPFILQTTHGTVVTGVIGGLHQGGCAAFTTYSSPFGASARRAYVRAASGARSDSAPAPGGDGC
jgi:V8-like Glu-specific endopeptidase